MDCIVHAVTESDMTELLSLSFWLCWLFLAACVFSSFEEQGLPFIGVHWLLIVVASLTVEHRL